MVSTAKHDQGNLPTDQMCDDVQDIAQDDAQINVQELNAQRAQPLAQNTAQPDDDTEGRREVALRVSTRQGSTATLARPKDQAPLTGLSCYEESTTSDSESHDENARCVSKNSRGAPIAQRPYLETTKERVDMNPSPFHAQDASPYDRPDVGTLPRDEGEGHNPTTDPSEEPPRKYTHGHKSGLASTNTGFKDTHSIHDSTRVIDAIAPPQRASPTASHV